MSSISANRRVGGALGEPQGPVTNGRIITSRREINSGGACNKTVVGATIFTA